MRLEKSLRYLGEDFGGGDGRGYRRDYRCECESRRAKWATNQDATTVDRKAASFGVSHQADGGADVGQSLCSEGCRLLQGLRMWGHSLAEKPKATP